MKPDEPRFELLQRYCDGMEMREEVAALERAILADAEFRKYAIEYLHLDSAMEEFGTVTEDRPVVKPAPSYRRWALAAAAVVAVMGLGLQHWWSGKAAPATVEVEVLQLEDARFGGVQGTLHVHDRVALAALDLRSGTAQVRLSSDVKLTLAGLAYIAFSDPMHARLRQGKVTADCGTRGQGFTLETPVARVVDVSTQFGVEARTDGATDVMVIKGSVQLFHPQATGAAAPLEQGEAVRVDAKQSLARIVNITGGPQPADWSTKPPAAECNIVSVSDNFGAAEGFHFYRIVQQGLKPGALVYSNRAYVWKAVDGKEFPASLQNADVVQTFFGELKWPAYAIELVVARPVELYVLMPRRGIPPAWLTESFTRTGEEIALDETGTSGRPRPGLPFDVWKRTVPQAGTITLGPGNRDANGNPTGMYGIAAKALSL